MVSYEVTQVLEDLSLADAFAEYMRNKHVREVVATGCFLDGRFEQTAPDVFRSRYTAASQEELDRYLAEHAAPLRADFLEHFPSGVKLTRHVWTEQARFLR